MDVFKISSSPKSVVLFIYIYKSMQVKVGPSLIINWLRKLLFFLYKIVENKQRIQAVGGNLEDASDEPPDFCKKIYVGAL